MYPSPHVVLDQMEREGETNRAIEEEGEMTEELKPTEGVTERGRDLVTPLGEVASVCRSCQKSFL